MIIDVHIHLSCPELASDRLPFLTGEIGLEALYSDPAAKLVTTSELLGDLDLAGVDKALVMGFPFAKEDNARRHNDWLLEECARYPGRLLPLAAFDPRAHWAIRHAEAFLDAGGFGLGELCVYDEGLTPFLLDQLEALGAACSVRSKVMLVHVNEPIGHQYPGKAPIEIGQIFELVKRCQGVKLILAHFGGGLPFLASLRKEVRPYLENVRFDTAAMPFLFEPKTLKLATELLGADYFLLGTDYPLLKTARYLKYFKDASLNPSDIEAICGQAAASFLELQ
ncbi:MAG: amidohydrolase [Deltaproteobacteria bacterium]|jgi:predicted TIM-barrel fold metal-dependent hydrolase|nr:amidohydrolase [Deltaproteobacteria bacterium]